MLLNIRLLMLGGICGLLVSYIYVNITTFVVFYCLLLSSQNSSSFFFYICKLIYLDLTFIWSSHRNLYFLLKKLSNRVIFGNELKSKDSLNLVPICVWISFRNLYPLICLSFTQAKCPDQNAYSRLKKASSLEMCEH